MSIYHLSLHIDICSIYKKILFYNHLKRTNYNGLIQMNEFDIGKDFKRLKSFFYVLISYIK